MVDVEAARGDIGGHKQVDRLVAQAIHDAIALVLGEAAMQRLRLIAASGQGLGKVVDLAAGAAEDDRGRRILGVEDAHDGGGLVEPLDDEGGLTDAGSVFGALGRRRDRDALGVAQVFARQLVDALGHRRGEEHRLPRLGCLGEDGLDVLDEAHLEHLVGLIENDRLDLAELERSAIAQVERASRSGDDHVDAAAQGLDLLTCRSAAVDRDQAHAHGLAVAAEGLGDLQGELTGGHEHQSAGLLAVAPGIEALEDRQGEGRGLARARGGLAQHVAAADEQRDRGSLDGRGLLVAEGIECGEEVAPQSQGGKVETGVVHGRTLPCWRTPFRSGRGLTSGPSPRRASWRDGGHPCRP